MNKKDIVIKTNLSLISALNDFHLIKYFIKLLGVSQFQNST